MAAASRRRYRLDVLSRSTSRSGFRESDPHAPEAVGRLRESVEKPTLLFLGASISQVPSLRYAREAGFRVVVVDANPEAVGFAVSDVAEQVDFTDVDRVTEVGARHLVAGVLAISSDRAVAPAAQVAAALGLPGIGPDVARAMTNKSVMRSRLEQCGVPQPEYRVLTRDTDVLRVAAGLEYPCVLKPADSGGQRGLFRIGAVDEVDEYLPEVLSLSRSGEAILEEYMPGTELNGLVVVREGTPTLLTLSDRLRPQGPAFGVGWIHSFPSRLSDAALESARDTAFAAVRGLGLQNGIAFPQLIVGDDATARLVEIAARIPAGQMADLARFAIGVELFDIAIAHALGRPVPDEMVVPRWVRPLAIRFLTASPGALPVGTVTSIEGLDAVRTAPGVLGAELYFRVGDRLGPLRVDADRSGYIVATGDSASAALERADAAMDRLVVRAHDDARVSSDAGTASVLPLTWLSTVGVVIVLLVVSLLGASLEARTGFHGRLVSAVRFGREVSPRCACGHEVVGLTFKLLRSTRVSVRVLSDLGQPIATLLRTTRLEAGWKQIDWNEHTDPRRLARDGTYRAEIAVGAPPRYILSPAVQIEPSAESGQHSAAAG
jgi:biotin carboxylase